MYSIQTGMPFKKPVYLRRFVFFVFFLPFVVVVVLLLFVVVVVLCFVWLVFCLGVCFC